MYSARIALYTAALLVLSIVFCMQMTHLYRDSTGENNCSKARASNCTDVKCLQEKMEHLETQLFEVR